MSIPKSTHIKAEEYVTNTFAAEYFTTPQRVIYIFEAPLFHSVEKFDANGNAPNIAIIFLIVSKHSKSSNSPHTFPEFIYDVKRIQQTRTTPRIATFKTVECNNLCK